MKLSHVMVSETGLKRTNNEDAVAFVVPDKPWIARSMGALAVVSDGMGGYERGEKASAMVVEHLSKTYFKEVGQPEEKLRQAAIQVNNAVVMEGAASSQKMGATCTAIAILPDVLYLMHIGDSRCYIFQNANLTQVTNDHTAANEMAQSVSLRNSEQTLLFNPHALTKAMGIKLSSGCQADVFSLKNTLQSGDRIVLCSDGVYLHMSDAELRDLLLQRLSLKETSDKLVKTILKRGAQDNFSFIIVEVQT